MTEREWLKSKNPIFMARHPNVKKSSNRKRILLGVSLKIVDEGMTEWAKDLLSRYHEILRTFADDVDQRSFLSKLTEMDRSRSGDDSHEDFETEFEMDITAFLSKNLIEDIVSHSEQKKRLAIAMIREIFGNPFRPVIIDPAWLAWSNSVVLALANTIYQEQTFNQLPILADALEDAGCANSEILDHLRSSGPHVRGCWVLDLVLGKK